MTPSVGFHTPTGPRSKILAIEDHKYVFPELWAQVFITNNNPAFKEMFARARCQMAKSLKDADLVVFTGGPDVDPQLYGRGRHPKTLINPNRDRMDIIMYDVAQARGVPMVGICRGAQFLHVMNGGKLFQDVDNHYGSHSITIKDSNKVIFPVSSTHHQMCAPNNRMRTLAVATRSTRRYWDAKDCSVGLSEDIEAYFYEETCCLGFQGHPEFRNYPAYTQWCLQMIKEFITEGNPQIEWRKDFPHDSDCNRHLRLKEDHIIKDVKLVLPQEEDPPFDPTDPKEVAKVEQKDDDARYAALICEAADKAAEMDDDVSDIAEDRKDRRRVKREQRRQGKLSLNP